MKSDTEYVEDSSRSRDVLEESTYLNLVRVHHELRNRFREFFETFDVTHRQYNVLRILYVRGREGLPCRVIREQLVTNVSDISRLIDRLVEKELVERERSEEDRRVVLIHLTEEGTKRCREVDGELVEHVEQQFRHMTQDQVERLNELLLDVLDRPDFSTEGGE